jgi:hypothetical protein
MFTRSQIIIGPRDTNKDLVIASISRVSTITTSGAIIEIIVALAIEESGHGLVRLIKLLWNKMRDCILSERYAILKII